MSKLLNRRKMLRGALATGAAIAVPLPVLDIMLNRNGTAFAQGQPLPRRYCTWFFGNGVLPKRWVPISTGPDWALSDQLVPLANVKPWLTVVSGLKRFIGGQPHPGGSAAATTGAPLTGTSAGGVSIDQVVADVIGKSTAFRSLEIGVTPATPNGPEATLHTVSHRGTNAPNYPEFDPHAVFARVFSGSVGGGANAAAMAKLNQAKKSVLDMVLTDAAELTSQLGANDKARLDQHLEGIRELENRLTGMSAATCTPPTDPTSQGVGEDKNSEAPPAVNEVMAEMAKLIFACDLTRVMSFMFSLPAAHVYYRHLAANMNDDFHDTICHGDPGDPSNQPRVHTGVMYAMNCLATFLQKLASVKEGGATVLDNSLVYITSCTSWGKTHTADEWPVLLAGKAGGSLSGNRHFRATVGDNLSKVLFSISQIMGGNPTSFGTAEGMVTQGLSGLA
jgi:hypothetical protein